MYNLDYFDRYIDNLSDKFGSDYFSLPAKLMHFKNSTYDIVEGILPFMEVDQKLSDEIKPLIKSSFRPLIQGLPRSFVSDDSFSPTVTENTYHVKDPSDYYRLISLTPYFDQKTPQKPNEVNTVCIKERILKLGQENIYKRSPYKKASEEHPHVYRESGIFRVEFGKTIVSGREYKTARIRYVTRPIFANPTTANINPNSTVKIVNLPDETIEKIIQRTAIAMRFTTGDPSAAQNFQFERTSKKRN